MKQARWIDSPEALSRFLSEIQQAPAWAIDTEFHREERFRPQLALVQISDGKRCGLIDPLAVDLSPLWRAMQQSRALKVFHAARQDFEVIWHQAGFLPEPLFDTQIAASLLGFGAQIGLAELVQRILGHTIPKHASYTNWLARPLSAEQRQYAAEDVLWLLPLQRRLDAMLQAQGRRAWLEEEQRRLFDRALYESSPEEAWRRVKGASRLKGRALARLQALAAWRERTASELDWPRRRVLSDELLVALARRDALDAAAIESLRASSGKKARRFADEILRAWQRGHTTPPEAWPNWPPSPTNTPGTQQRKQLLDALARMRAESCGVAVSILAPKEELMALASWGANPNDKEPALAILSGWRRKLIGEDLLRLLRGEIALAIDAKHRPTTIPIGELR